MKLPWVIVDAKSSHADGSVRAYPLQKTLLGAIVHKSAVLVQGITMPEIARSWGAPEAGKLRAGVGVCVCPMAVCACLRMKPSKL